MVHLCCSPRCSWASTMSVKIRPFYLITEIVSNSRVFSSHVYAFKTSRMEGDKIMENDARFISLLMWTTSGLALSTCTRIKLSIGMNTGKSSFCIIRILYRRRLAVIIVRGWNFHFYLLIIQHVFCLSILHGSEYIYNHCGHITVNVLWWWEGKEKLRLYLNFWIIHYFHFIADERRDFEGFTEALRFFYDLNGWMIRWQAQEQLRNIECLMEARVCLTWFLLFKQLAIHNTRRNDAIKSFNDSLQSTTTTARLSTTSYWLLDWNILVYLTRFYNKFMLLWYK